MQRIRFGHEPKGTSLDIGNPYLFSRNKVVLFNITKPLKWGENIR
jgi:hypothetical protein